MNLLRKLYFKPDIFSVFGIISILIFCITAYISEGFHHPDEHYQIIEFACVKLGITQASELPWEYEAGIRPSFQIAIFYAFISIFKFFSITDSYTQIFLIRLITAFLAFFVLRYFFRSFAVEFLGKWRIMFFFFNFFLFFQPYLNVRFSSENWSGIFFLVALCITTNRQKIKYWTIILGCFLGFSFLCRYHAAFLAFGICIWLLFIAKERFINLFKIFAAFLFVFLIGFILDYWYYEKIIFTAYNYFDYNILRGVAAKNFGSMPWNFYIKYLAEFPVFGMVLMFCFVLFIIRKPKHLILWAVLPFLLVHFLTEHKEGRFLFPLANLSGFIIVIALQLPEHTQARIKNSFENWRNSALKKISIYTTKFILILVFIICILSNIFATIFVSTFKTEIHGQISVLRKIHNLKINNKILIYNEISPYLDCGKLQFYADTFPIIKKSEYQLVEFLATNKSEKIIVLKHWEINEMLSKVLDTLKCEKIFQGVANWQIEVGKYLGIYKAERNLYVYHFNNKNQQLALNYVNTLKDKLEKERVNVVVFQHCNYNDAGYKVYLPEGKYTMANLLNKGIQRNDISSLKIPFEYKVSLFSGDSLNGDSIEISKSTACFTDFGWNDKVNSLKISKRENIIDCEFFTDCSWSGQSLTLKEGRYDLDQLRSFGFPNDRLSSVGVAPGYEVVLYEHRSFDGYSIVLSRTTSELGDFDNKTSSIVVKKQND